MSDNPSTQTEQQDKGTGKSGRGGKSADQPASEAIQSVAGPDSRADDEQEHLPEPPTVNLDQFKARLAADVNHYGLELARRVLGELHIASIGGAPASKVAQEGLEQLENGEAQWWNERGKELAEKEFRGMNQRGSLVGTPQTDVPENPPEAYQAATSGAPAAGGVSGGQGAGGRA
jgi:hypothetical protein